MSIIRRAFRLLPWRWRAWVKDQIARRQQSFYAFKYDRYRRERAALYGDDRRGLRTPAVPGLVSIVLPAYNGEDMIREALDSILAQTYPHWELIAINDGSRDQTPTILDEYAARDPRIRVIHQENRKIPRTLSRGFQAARGEFLTWTSCDNRLKPNCLAQLVGSLQRHPCWEMVYADLDIIGEDGAPLRGTDWYGGYQRPPGSEHIFLPNVTDVLNVYPNNYIGAAFMYRSRAAYLIGDYSRNRFTTEDYDYWMRVNNLLTLRHADFAEPIYEYRFHSTSLTAKDKELGITRSRDRLMIFDDFRRDFALTPLLWVIDADNPADDLARGLRERLTSAGHLVYTPEAGYRLNDLPPLFVSVVYARITDAPAAAAPPTDLPPHTLRALIVPAGVSLPTSIAADWDTCIALDDGSASVLPALDGAYRGWLGARDTDILFHALDVIAKERHMAAVETTAAQLPPAPRRASVIICTHRYNERLVRALQAAAAQDLAPAEYEVILVNNNPANKDIPALVERLRAELFDGDSERLRLVVCPVTGLSSARNAGLAAARGEIICFVDDDAYAAPNAVSSLLKAYADHPEAGVIGGRILLQLPEPRPAGILPGWEKYWSHFDPPYTGYTKVDWHHYPWGANWSARREALWKIGGFRTGYGRRKDDYGGGEEIIAAALIERLGYAVAVEPESAVTHDIEPRRYTPNAVRQTQIAVHFGGYRQRIDLYVPMTHNLLWNLKSLLLFHVDPQIGWRGRGAWADIAYRKEAQARLLLRQLVDYAKRFRAPYVSHGDCV